MVNFFADRVNRIKPSPTIAVTTRARELKSEGHDVIGLGAGEPDFDTPDHIKEAGIEAIKKGVTKYTAVDGTPELKEAIKNKFLKDNKLSYENHQISVGNGGKQILYNALLSTINSGDEVLIPSPYWVSYPDMVLLANGIPRIINTKVENNFKITPEDLEKSISNKTKWIIMNSPSNPTGNAYSHKELSELSEIIEKNRHIWVMSDDIYEKVIYDEFQFSTIAQINPNIQDRVLTVNGVSKAYSMTGWRIGYAGGPRDLIKSMAKIQSQSTSNPCSISQAAALAALLGSEEFLLERNNAFKKRRNLILDKIGMSKGLICNKPEGAFYVFPSCKSLFGKKDPDGNVIKNSNDFCQYLLEKVGVAVVSGSAFGMEGHFRISYATSDQILSDAGDRIIKFCNSIC